MRRFVTAATVIVAVLGAGSLYGSQDLGPASPLGDYHEVSWAFGYHNYTSEWEADAEEAQTQEITQNNYWLQIAYAFTREWEVYARVGFADAKVKELIPFDPPKDFEGSHEPNFTFGLRGVFYESQRWGVGPVLQGSFYSDYEYEATGELPEGSPAEAATITARLENLIDVNVGIAAEVDAGGGAFYAGAMGYWTEARGWEEYQEISLDPPPPERSSVDLNEKNNFGGFLGARFPLGATFSLHAEVQYKSDASFSIVLSQKLGDYF